MNDYTYVCHDSGNPYERGEKIIAHYRKYGVDPKKKLLLFSNSLDFDKAQNLYDRFCVNCAPGFLSTQPVRHKRVPAVTRLHCAA